MKRRFMTLVVTLPVAATCVLACSAESGSSDPYAAQADEVEWLAQALDEEMTADETDEAVSDGTMEGMRDAARRGRHHRGQRGHGPGGRGHLLRWFGDPEALQACRDMRDACMPDDATCRDAVKACVEDVLEQAFAELCAEATTMCAEDGAPERHCGRIEAACSGDFDALRDGFGHGGHHRDGGMLDDREDRGDSDRGHRDHDGPPEVDGGMDM